MLIKQKNKLFELRGKGLKFVYCYGKGLSLLANRGFKDGEVVIKMSGKAVPVERSSKEAVQIDNNNFLDSEYMVVEDFINHSCRPNTHCDIENRKFVAIKDIVADEEITFNYCTTELDMKKYGTDFSCECGAKSCYGKVMGFKYLASEEQKRLLPYLSPFLKTKVI
ncbi:MAG: SET domain-containing protein [Candidatus Spechtbacteria bacterium]|nr:SET domain-containing protein [Candidatus Spechtbacteria bacterium]